MNAPVTQAIPSLNEEDLRIEDAIERLCQLLIQGHGLVCGWSGGKDSSCVLVLMINAMLRVRAMGYKLPKCFLVTADTLIENPEVVYNKYLMLKHLWAYTAEHGLPLEAHVSMPNIMSTFQVQVIGGRALPTYASSKNRQCSVDLKVEPNQRTLRQIEKSLSKDEAAKLVTLLGSRLDESTVRAQNITKQGGSAVQVTTDKQGKHFFYPIVDWTADTVWWCLAKSGTDKNKTWAGCAPNHDPLVELYRSSAGGECVVFQPDIKEGDEITQQGSQSCGARHGCWNCQAVDNDQSMAALVADPDFAWMAPLMRIRDYIATLRYDWSKRRIATRSIRNRHIKLEPTTFNFQTCRELLKACLTADRDEKRRAHKVALELAAGLLEDNARNRRMAEPQFEIIDERHLLGIQWNWAVLGMEPRPFEALKVWHEVYYKAESLTLPEPTPVPKTPVPKARWLEVGSDWYVGNFGRGGLFDAVGQMVSRDELDLCALDRQLKTKYGTKTVPYFDDAQALEIDMEAAALLMDFELEYLLERYNDDMYLPALTASKLLRMGVVKVPYSKRAQYDEMIARSNWFKQNGLTADLSYEAMVAQGIGVETAVYKRRVSQQLKRKKRQRRLAA